MIVAHKKYLESQGWALDKFLVFNAQMTHIATQLEGSGMCCVPISESDGLGKGFSIVQKRWAEANNLMVPYKEWMPQSDIQEDGKAMMPTMTPDKPSVPPAPVENNALSELDNFSANQDGIQDLPTAPTEEAPFPNVEKRVPISPPVPNPKVLVELTAEDWAIKIAMIAEGLNLNVASARFSLTGKLGFASNGKYEVYLNESEDRAISKSVVTYMNNDAMGFVQYVAKCMVSPWSPETHRGHIANRSMDEVVPEVVEEITIVTKEEEVTSMGYEQNSVPDILPVEKEVVEVQTKQSMTIDEKVAEFTDLGYEYNKKKKMFKLSANLNVSVASLDLIPDSEWKAYKEKCQANYKATLQKVEQMDVVVELVKEEEVAGKKAESEHLVSRSIVGTGFFSRLLSYKFHKVSLTFVRIDAERFRLEVKPSSEMKDAALLDLAPMNLTGTAEEFDKGFFSEIDKPLAESSKLFGQADKYLKDLKAAEKKTKMIKDHEGNLKKVLDHAEKYAGGDKTTEATLKKNWNAVLALDPKNKKALEAMNEISSPKIL